MGKYHRMSYPLRVHKRVDRLFDLVRSVAWGLGHVSLKLGFRYFIIFVDDYSRITWLYSMKIIQNTVFQNFCAKIKKSLVRLFIF